MNLSLFNTASLFESATDLFRQLNIKLNSNTTEPLPVRDLLKQHFRDTEIFKAIGKTFFIGIIDDSVFEQTGMFDVNYSYKEALQQADKSYNGLMLFALELSEHPNRSEISELTRAFNRISQKMPVALVLKYTSPPLQQERGENAEVVISISISERFKYKQSWRQGEKAGKVIILRDIHSQTTHAGHLRILLDLVKPVAVSNYAQLHEHWLQVLDVSILNKKFFQELANWYFWAMDNVQFPDDIEKKKDVRNATNLIRLITRVIFIWFIKEKSLVPNSLFNKTHLLKILKDFNKNKKADSYYHAILQNLFFGTLNQKMTERSFAKEGSYEDNRKEFGVKNLFRYADKFSISDKEVLQMFKDVPFLNGGLFDCLDKPNDEGKILYVDGFSRNVKRQASVPDYLFFGEETEVDLNEIYATKNKKYTVKGLVNLLESYKFTVAENTPIEEEIALDPELLGKVFENLLASYNPETQTTARKQTGSFYTPREIVNYMVDESLLEYLKSTVSIPTDGFNSIRSRDAFDTFENRLRDLFSYSENPNPFNEKETKNLIEAINNCKILDPACGSGAFPMGVLHKMVHILQKLDKENIHWKALQRTKAIEETETAYKGDNKEEREKRLIEINDVFENNASDYGRKLYLIENCIYGIDIQPIAVQIAKLRFFISLIIDQNKQEGKENFGIRSLPNLETKFVAANTLIGLDKPAQEMFRNPDIEEKEKQLKELRHNYFTAKTRKEKIRLQDADKTLRKEIAKLLEDDGWNTTVAKQIVAFDPYDQNLSAPFFESEWMFGLTDGFDIVIGNPPYKIISADDDFILYFKEKYRCSSGGKINLYKLFFEKGLLLLKKKGTLTFITPYNYLTSGDSLKLREILLKETTIKEIIDYEESEKIFESVTQAVATIVISLQINIDYSFNYLKLGIPYLLEVKKILSDKDLLIKGDNIAIARIKKHQTIFDEIVLGFQGEINVSTKKEYFVSTRKAGHLPLIRGNQIGQYQTIASPVEYCPTSVSNRDHYKYRRIVFQEVSNSGLAKRVKATILENILCGHTTNYIIPKKNQSLEAVLGLLNSSTVNFYFKFYNQTNHIPIGEIKKIPVPDNFLSESKKIKLIVDKILSAKEKNPQADTSKFEKQLDEMVYKLYELTQEEIKTIEGN